MKSHLKYILLISIFLTFKKGRCQYIYFPSPSNMRTEIRPGVYSPPSNVSAYSQSMSNLQINDYIDDLTHN